LYSLPEFCVKQDCKTVGTNVFCVSVCLVVMTCVSFISVAIGQSGRAPLIVLVIETFGRAVWNSDQSVTRHRPRIDEEKTETTIPIFGLRRHYMS